MDCHSGDPGLIPIETDVIQSYKAGHPTKTAPALSDIVFLRFANFLHVNLC